MTQTQALEADCKPLYSRKAHKCPVPVVPPPGEGGCIDNLILSFTAYNEWLAAYVSKQHVKRTTIASICKTYVLLKGQDCARYSKVIGAPWHGTRLPQTSAHAAAGPHSWHLAAGPALVADSLAPQ